MIRFADVQDTDGIMELLRQVLAVHHKGRPDLFKGEGTKYTPEQLKQMFNDEAYRIFVYTDDAGQVLAHCFCEVHEYRETTNTYGCRNLYIDDLCVREDQRGKHIGSELYRYVKQYAHDQQFYNLTLNVWACNPAALAFYQKMGLQPQKTTMEQIL